MDLNNIQLAPKQMVDLYKNSLIDITQSKIPFDTYPDFLGNNEKNILIITSKEDVDYLTEEELSFLTNILSACKLKLADVAIINFKKTLKHKEELVQTFKSTAVLLFDVDPITFGLPINFPSFQTQEFNKCLYLYAPGLTAIEKDVSLKKQFWQSLKKLFQL